MEYLLIPFLLGSQIPALRENWKFGPEYTFAVNMSMITNLTEDKGQLYGNHMLAKMKCWPLPPDTLLCKFQDSSIAKIAPKAFNSSAAVTDENSLFRPFGIGRRTHFGLKFTFRGVETVFVEDSDLFTLNMIRLIAVQLGIGWIPITAENQPGSDGFVRLENSTIGECSAKFEVTSKVLEDGDPRVGERINGVRIFPENEMDFPQLTGNKVVTIKTRRNPEDCLRRSNYDFGTRYIFGFVFRDVITKLKSSVSHITVTENSFSSDTTYESELYDKKRIKLGAVLDYVSLSLESVEPAESALKPIQGAEPKEILMGFCDQKGTYF